MTIIDKTKPPSWILQHKPKPVFKSEYERSKYWSGEKIKWIEGENGIPGTLLHKTQEQKIKNRNTGAIFRPVCRDLDLLIHEEIEKSRKAGQALAIIKGRGIGLSCEMGCLANYFMQVFPGSTSFFTSSEQSKISTIFSEKVMTTFNEYDLDIRPIIANKNETKNSAYLKAEIKSKRDNEEFIAFSKIFCKETADNDASASGFSGEGAIFGAYDELFLHKRRNLLLKSSASCYVEQSTGEVTGFLLAGGSVEETLTNEELHLLQVLITDIQKNKRLGTIPARLLFIPATWGKFMTNGHTDHKRAMQWWETEIEALEKMDDKSALRAFKMNNPMTLDDIFDLASGSFFEEDVSDKIKLQHEHICAEEPEPLQTPHKLISLSGTYEAKPDKKGVIFIQEHPQEQIDYYLLVDGVATGERTGSEDRSNVAGIIMAMFNPRGFSYQPVAVYYEQPKTIESSYRNLVDLAKYYNKFGGMRKIEAEGNAGTADHFGTYLQNEGLASWIPDRKDLTGKGNINTNKIFNYVNKDVQDWQIRQMNIILRKYITSIRMKMILEDLMKPATVNADLRSALLMFPIAVGADFDKPAKAIAPPVLRQKRPYYIMRGGVSHLVWK